MEKVEKGFEELLRLFNKLGRVVVPFIGLEELVKNKKKAARPQDLADLNIIRKKRRKK